MRAVHCVTAKQGAAAAERLRFPLVGDLAGSASDGRVWVHCREGNVWVTQEDDPQDHVLLGGDSFRVEMGRSPVLSLAPASVVEIRAGERPR